MPTMFGNTTTIGSQSNNYFFISWSGIDSPSTNSTTINWGAYFHFTLADSQLDNGVADLNGGRWSATRALNFTGNFTTRDVLLASGSFVVNHNANGEATLNVSGGVTPVGGTRSQGSASYALTNYDRKPAAPTTVTASVGAGKAITVTSNEVSSPAGTPTYYVGSAQSDDGGATFGAWSSYITIPSNARSYTYTLGSLPVGKAYKFRMYASNTDGNSAATESNIVFLPAGGRRWDGSQWATTSIARRWDGSQWQDIVIAKRWDGSSWQDLS